ncbi:hypothetical protein AB0467_09590 [Streptomyces sp. NPDC052095]|uniref:hypothetical protein n=1 Tax=unclassified Streptomyces TaxID=2593676 RepID=UPI00344E9381
MSVRVLARAVGRRTLLRCLAAGAGAVVVSACSGNGTGGGVKAQALKAFATGTWDWKANRDGDGSGTVTIGDGTWSVRASGDASGDALSGTWTYENGAVDVVVGGSLTYLKLRDVPADVPDGISKHLPCEGEFGKADATYDGSRLRLSFNDGNLVLICTRAA